MEYFLALPLQAGHTTFFCLLSPIMEGNTEETFDVPRSEEKYTWMKEEALSERTYEYLLHYLAQQHRISLHSDVDQNKTKTKNQGK